MKIVFSGGGTAGHVTPNLALIDKLQTEEIYYIGTDGMERALTAPYLESGKIKEGMRTGTGKRIGEGRQGNRNG